MVYEPYSIDGATYYFLTDPKAVKEKLKETQPKQNFNVNSIQLQDNFPIK
jgi:hypothetical protein